MDYKILNLLENGREQGLSEHFLYNTCSEGIFIFSQPFYVEKRLYLYERDNAKT